MKTAIRLLLILFSTTFFFSCDDYNDSGLKKEIQEIKTDVEALKKQLTSVESLVDAMQKNKLISNVEELDGGKGYLITFTDNSTIEVLRGNSESALSVKKEGENYYWTVVTSGKSEFLLDNSGRKIAVTDRTVGYDENGYWLANNQKIKDANGELIRFKKDEDSFYKDIIIEDDRVIFVLVDDSRVEVAKSQGTYLYLEDNQGQPYYVAEPGETLEIPMFVSKDILNLEIVSSPQNWDIKLDREANKMVVSIPESASNDNYKLRLEGTDKKGLLYTGIAQIALPESGDPNFTMDDIEFWVGNGENSAALVVQWNDGKSPDALVWGYRWDGEAVGNDMVRAIAAADPKFILLTHMTGPMGFTVAGLGYNMDSSDKHFLFFEGNAEDPRLPDENNVVMTDAYNYDDWSYANENGHWRSGWYQGYWSYFVKESQPQKWNYSGLGASSRQLADGSWDGWSFLADMTQFEGAKLGMKFTAAPKLAN